MLRGRVNLLPLLLVLGGMGGGQLLALAHDGKTVPLGVELGFGLVFGCTTALAAIGLVLVYRASRVINFAQGGFGVGAAGLFLMLTSVWHWSYWLALPACVAAGALAAFAAEALLMRRFSRSPRLVVTVVTIVVGQLLAGASLLLPSLFGFHSDKPGALPAGIPTEPPVTPFDHVHVTWGPIRFSGDHAAVVAATVLVLVALTWFLRRSRTGIAVRGASENSARAEELGVSVGLLSSAIWVIVGAISALAAVLAANAAGQSVAGSLIGGAAVGGASLGGLLRALTAAVIGRLEELPTTVAAAIGISMFEQCVRWTYSDSALVDLLLFVTILTALLFQRSRSGRVDAGVTSSWVGAEEIRPIPHELAGLEGVKAGVRRLRWLIAVVLLAYPFVMSAGQVTLGATFAIYGIIGVSLVVLTGWAGQISLGQFAFVTVGAVVGGAVTGRAGLPFVAALVIGTAAAALVAVVVGLPALRVQGLYLAVTTLSLAGVTSTVLVSPTYFGWLLPKEVRRPDVLGIDMNTDTRAYYYVCVLGAAMAIYVASRLRSSRVGRLLIAMRDNERMAQAYGQNLVRARLTAFALSGAMAGFAGVLFVHLQRGVTPGSYGPEQSVSMFLMAVLGGLGSVYAVLAGAVYLAVTGTLISGVAGQLLASGLGVLAVLLFFPAGLGALAFEGRDAWLRRLAQRLRIFVPSLAGGSIKRGEEALVAIVAPVLDHGPYVMRFRLPSRIGQTGASQLEKVWRY